ncbi:MAG: dipeptidase [Blastocatellia bacterium]|nr:dipeptidase [Blastocatellia bacterium]
MKIPVKKTLIALSMILIAGLVVLFFVVPGYVEKGLNKTLNPPPYRASERAGELHKKLLVADLHADTLLWDRDLLERDTRGHVDIPRLIEGNVALQAFTVVTKVSSSASIDSNDGREDDITLLAFVQLWPIAAWSSLKERALYQAKRLREISDRSNGKLTLIKTADELTAYLERRRRDSTITAGFLGIEGAQALDGDLSNIDLLFDAGFRMMAPTHFYDNDIAGSAHGMEKGGLTEKGREMIRRMEAKRMIVDLAHASQKTIDDVLAIATRPVVVSHTGVRGTCDNNRNLSDHHIKSIAATGGVIGIGYWDTAVCGQDAKAIARAIAYTAGLAGVEHIGLGSDYDGAIPAPFDTTGLVLITEALLEEGFSEAEIEMIMGGNILRVLKENLP